MPRERRFRPSWTTGNGAPAPMARGLLVCTPMKLLKAVLLVEILLGVLWTAAVVGDPNSLGILLVFAVLAPVALVCISLGAWKAIKEPESRALATWVILSPLAFLFLPGALRVMPGGANLGGAKAVWVVIAAPFLLILFRPRSVGAYLPRFVVRSRRFNVVVLCGLIVVLGAIGLLLLSIVNPELARSDIQPALAALVPIAAGGAVYAVAVLLVAYLGLFQPEGREHNGLRIAQIVFAVPIPLSVAAGFLMVAALSYG